MTDILDRELDEMESRYAAANRELEQEIANGNTIANTRLRRIQGHLESIAKIARANIVRGKNSQMIVNVEPARDGVSGLDISIKWKEPNKRTAVERTIAALEYARSAGHENGN